MENKKFRRISATLNNYSNEDIKHFENLTNNGVIKYCLIGEEVGDKGTKHLQIYIEFNKQLRFKQIKNIHKLMHFESSKGDNIDNKIYCSKELKYHEFGDKRVPGKRNDLIDIKKKIDNNIELDSIINNCINYQQIKYCEKLLNYKQLKIKDRKQMKIIYIHGKSGSGKTTLARNKCSDNTYIHNGDFNWFDGYNFHKEVIFDDFRDHQVKIDFLIRLIDGYELRVPIKGGFTIWSPDTIYFTSVVAPNDLYDNPFIKDDNVEQLTRRITEIIHLDD